MHDSVISTGIFPAPSNKCQKRPQTLHDFARILEKVFPEVLRSPELLNIRECCGSLWCETSGRSPRANTSDVHSRRRSESDLWMMKSDRTHSRSETISLRCRTSLRLARHKERCQKNSAMAGRFRQYSLCPPAIIGPGGSRTHDFACPSTHGIGDSADQIARMTRSFRST